MRSWSRLAGLPRPNWPIAYVESLYLIDPAGRFRWRYLPNKRNQSFLCIKSSVNLLLKTFALQ